MTQTFFRRGTDHLGFLGAKLRDLMGFTTLAHELIQNADDAPNTLAMTFDVRDDALIVDNDGSFADCNHPGDPECPWKQDPARNRMCDFHRFQYVASGDKRDELGTAGAFGIGFTAVYQITDRPELISSKRHWIIDESKPENERIRQCDGCPTCLDKTVPATRFIFPWANNPQSELRQRLRVDVVGDSAPGDLLDELLRAVPLAMLFLKQLSQIRVLRNGNAVKAIRRIVHGDRVEISDGDSVSNWFCFPADFSEHAAKLRGEHPNKIEPKRGATVTIAVPAEGSHDGVFCAFLPTQQTTGLPFHINADFFPKSDRKEIILEADFQSHWNRAAINAAAKGLAAALLTLRDRVGHTQLWTIIECIERVSRDAANGQRDKSLGCFWEHLSLVIGGSPVVFSSKKMWVTPAESFFLEREQETESLPVLEGLKLHVAHNDLRFAQNLLVSKTVGVRLLGGRELAIALRTNGLDKRVTFNTLPKYLRAEGALALLWSEVDRLLEQASRREQAKRKEIEGELASCAFAPAIDGTLWPCKQIFRTDEESASLFGRLLPNTPFLAENSASGTIFEVLCPLFNAKAAIEAISLVKQESIIDLIRKQIVTLGTLFSWFENRRSELISDKSVRNAFVNLPIFPSSNGLEVLADLSLPGGFVDPLGLTAIVDLDALGGRSQFLRDLDAKELTLEDYARDFVPTGLRNDKLSPDKRRQVVLLLANELGRIRNDDETREALKSVAIVECNDGAFRVPDSVYFSSEIIETVLGNDANVTVIPATHQESVKAFYTWLGVRALPRFSGVVKRIERLTSSPPTPAAIENVRTLFSHLAGRVHDNEMHGVLSILKAREWLPARGDRKRWHKPEELHADFNAYLFESQATFIDLPQRMQQSGTELLDVLGVRSAPTESQVVAHLLHSADRKLLVNRDVYRWLNDRHEHSSISRLDGKPCLMLGDGHYARPQDVYWQPHSFGRYRHQLGADLRRYNDLLQRLRVKENPSCSDAVNILRELAEEFGGRNIPVDLETQSVVLACWKMLDRGLEEELISNERLEELRAVKVVCAPNNILVIPERLFFDDRPGLAAKFGTFLQNSVIQRTQGAWQAMAVAGVTPLSEAVESQLAEKTDPRDDIGVRSRLVERWDLLVRVLESHRSGLAQQLDRLEELQYVSADRLIVTYTVRAYGREMQSAAEPVQAHFRRAENVLYFVRREGNPPWTPIARELAALFSPEEEPGGLASLIKEVLSSDDLEATIAVLDELGIPVTASASIGTIRDSAPVEELGIESDEREEVEANTAEAIPNSRTMGDIQPEDASNSQNESINQTGRTDGKEPDASFDPIAALLGDGTPGPTPLPGELNRPDRPTTLVPGSQMGSQRRPTPPSTSTGVGGSGNGRSPSSHPGQRGERPGYAVLRSYVMPDRPTDSMPGDDERHAHRTETDQAGINHVLMHEIAENREPNEKPPMYPGYDVESANQVGVIERFIEVKSLSGDWRDADAGMTKTQFEKAVELGDRYWLYIVERAQQDDFQIHCIQDPAGKANRFMFDPGWKLVATGPTDGNSLENCNA